MRVTIKIDSVHENELQSVLWAHRTAVRSSEPPTSIEASESLAFNGGAVVCIMGRGFDVKTIAMTPEQASVFTDTLNNG